MSIVTQVLDAFIQALRDIQITQFSQLSSGSIIIFEHVITFSDEVELIWKSTWTLGKMLFLLNRYYSLAAVIFNNYVVSVTWSPRQIPMPHRLISHIRFASILFLPSCAHFFRWQGWTGFIGCLLAEAILQMRLYALYSLNKKVLALMLTCWVASLAVSGYVMGSVLSQINVTAFMIPGGRFCVPLRVSSHFYVFWIPMLAFESLLCSLALVRGIQTYRSNGSLFQSGRQLIGILVRDSILYFLIICGAYLTCLLIWIIAPVSLLGVPIGYALAMSCVMSNRIVLNVRAVSRDVNESRLPTSDKVISTHHSHHHEVSFGGPGTLTTYEMVQLRTMRAEKQYTKEVDLEELDHSFIVL